jgi:cellulose synthase/poly-beta-1,6-N-acetylglucosamine synthase-like glycosyltransferase
VVDDLLLTGILLLPALALGLPTLVDTSALVKGLFRRRAAAGSTFGRQQPLLFLVPAHDEALLIDRCVRSLLGQDYPRSLLAVVVLADNCTDDTAARARTGGAQVLERVDQRERGKGHAIGWALQRLPLEQYAAVVIVDADTIVEPDYASALMAFAPLEGRAMQTFDGASNEFETWLTRMAGLLTRNRYDIALPLKVGAGLTCPMTGDGVVLGTGLLKEHPWRVATITEGWELYARLTLAGVAVDYAPRARLYAQETRDMGESGTQRQRWTSGRLAVLRLYWKKILTQPGIGFLQRLDLLAELTSLGPVVRGVLGVVGTGLTWWIQPPGTGAIAALYATAFLQPAVYSFISLSRHPQPGRTALAFLRFPLYAGWRLWVGLRAFLTTGRGRWVRTARRSEP